MVEYILEAAIGAVIVTCSVSSNLIYVVILINHFQCFAYSRRKIFYMHRRHKFMSRWVFSQRGRSADEAALAALTQTSLAGWRSESTSFAAGFPASPWSLITTLCLTWRRTRALPPPSVDRGYTSEFLREEHFKNCPPWEINHTLYYSGTFFISSFSKYDSQQTDV